MQIHRLITPCGSYTVAYMYIIAVFEMCTCTYTYIYIYIFVHISTYACIAAMSSLLLMAPHIPGVFARQHRLNFPQVSSSSVTTKQIFSCCCCCNSTNDLLQVAYCFSARGRKKESLIASWKEAYQQSYSRASLWLCSSCKCIQRVDLSETQVQCLVRGFLPSLLNKRLEQIKEISSLIPTVPIYFWVVGALVEALVLLFYFWYLFYASRKKIK